MYFLTQQKDLTLNNLQNNNIFVSKNYDLFTFSELPSISLPLYHYCSIEQCILDTYGGKQLSWAITDI